MMSLAQGKHLVKHDEYILPNPNMHISAAFELKKITLIHPLLGKSKAEPKEKKKKKKLYPINTHDCNLLHRFGLPHSTESLNHTG